MWALGTMTAGVVRYPSYPSLRARHSSPPPSRSLAGSSLPWSYRSWQLFPPQLLKTHEISPSQNYILVYHPHGLMCHSGFGNFATEASGFSKIFPGITPYVLTLGALFWVPFFRDYVMSAGEWALRTEKQKRLSCRAVRLRALGIIL